MLDNIHTKTSLYLAISLFCFLGVLLPIPLAPITFSVSACLLLLARESYIRASDDGQAELLRVKLGLTMAMCFGNMLATAMMVALFVLAVYITLSNPLPFKDMPLPPSRSEKRSNELNTEINIEHFRQSNY